MISYSEALRIVIEAARLQPCQDLRLDELDRHVSAQNIASTRDVPGFDNSAMDGFALRAGDTAGASETRPVRLAVAGTLRAGVVSAESTPERASWEIMTGAALPGDCDAVVPVERTRLETATDGRHSVLISVPAEIGANVRRRAEDFRVGQSVLEAGRSISPAEVMALAAIGADRVSVRRKPRVVVLCTGDELRTAPATDQPGVIADANGPYLASLLPELGAVVASSARAGDDAAELRSALLGATHAGDIVVTTGGVSAGSADLVPDALRAIGAAILFHRVAIRPGKPVLFGRMPSGVPLLALPGNPLAVAVGARFLLAPLLRAMLGQRPESYRTARTPAAIRRRGDLVFFAKARTTIGAGAVSQVEILPGQESFKISPLLSANCWAIVPPGGGSVPAGELVDVAPLYPGPFPGED